ncbi:vWA domain-containing protein [Haloactinomyces albus]|uniref:Uncharacterized protein with von Willebrand factor type A (VWA) domain n=1 Tax=Haloactinomyces albus TaxID=1352928 RepID=A0AAE3ZAW9_9ACTN|nr:VWA domain-containing protein [Haloactinomyces albus]MDR7301547.1 uncharacterized protein with von Willebrand factor type A (vWA) domain [Haloactinomyces albus]
MGGVDHTVGGLVGFARALRHSGMMCGPNRVQAFLAAVEHVDLADRSRLYWAGRLTLCADPEDLPRFDAAFDYWFRGADMPSRGQTSSTERRARSAALSSRDTEPGEPEPLATAAGDAEVLHNRDLADLSAEEREQLRRLFAELEPEPPQRPAFRHRSSRRGQLDPRATMRALLRTGGEPIRLPRRNRTTRARRVVLLIDVSGSMSPYADALLRFAHVVVRRSPTHTEVVTLGTRMTRVSRQLRHRDPEQALAAAAKAVPDFSGGTRLGETLRVFLDRWGRRGAARRAVVVLFSDGWERGDTSVLAEQMQRLRRLAHAVVWVNPHAGRAGYSPVQSGIAAAWPYVDHLVAGHSLRSLQELWWWVRRLARNRGSGWATTADQWGSRREGERGGAA